MDIKPATWDFLRERDFVEDADAAELSGAGVVLSDLAREVKLENGLLFAKILRNYDAKGNADLQTLKTARTPVARLYNWSVLQGALSSILHFEIDMDTKALLVAGDTGVGLALLTDVVTRAKEREENAKLGLGDESDNDTVVSSIDIDTTRPLRRCLRAPRRKHFQRKSQLRQQPHPQNIRTRCTR